MHQALTTGRKLSNLSVQRKELEIAVGTLRMQQEKN